MTADPVDLVYVNDVPVSKSDVRSFDKVRHRANLADADEVRNTSLSGRYAGIYVRSLQVGFDLDTLDTTTEDDGINCIIDSDGNVFKRVAVNPAKTQRKVTAAGAVTALPDDDIIIIAKTVGAATTVSVDWSARTKALTVVDGKGDANANTISIVPAVGQTQYGIVDYVVVIDGNGGQVTLTPLSDGSGAF